MVMMIIVTVVVVIIVTVMVMHSCDCSDGYGDCHGDGDKPRASLRSPAGKYFHKRDACCVHTDSIVHTLGENGCHR